uniref:ZP domain-containing protein n=1 Tax=Rhabditophanes sp. KR3021 TaxID=114890 RepID=A0AC35TWI3_9BILA
MLFCRQKGHVMLGFFLFVNGVSAAYALRPSSVNPLDNTITGEPIVECLEDRVKITFRTEKPFGGRVFVKGMIDTNECVTQFSGNNKNAIDFEILNGQCNMRRSRKVGPDQKGVEQSVTVIISFHDTFITKVDRAYRTTCFYVEVDKIVTSSLDVSALPTTDITDTAKMPVCTYTVRRGSVTGAVVSYAVVGEPVFHVWTCDSDMYSMLVMSCYIDDGDGKDRRELIDEHGCSKDTLILPELTYNPQNNLAYSEVNVFKFADKVTTYFQCAVSTCLTSDGTCVGRTPPRCAGSGGSSNNKPTRIKRTLEGGNVTAPVKKVKAEGMFTVDLSADKIIVLDLDDTEHKNFGNVISKEENLASAIILKNNLESLRSAKDHDQVCLSHPILITMFILSGTTLSAATALFISFIVRRNRQDSVTLFNKH